MKETPRMIPTNRSAVDSFGDRSFWTIWKIHTMGMAASTAPTLSSFNVS